MNYKLWKSTALDNITSLSRLFEILMPPTLFIQSEIHCGYCTIAWLSLYWSTSFSYRLWSKGVASKLPTDMQTDTCIYWHITLNFWESEGVIKRIPQMTLQLKFHIRICPLVSTGMSGRCAGYANSASDYHREVDVIKSESYNFFSSLVCILLQSVRFEIALSLQETGIFH